jgi:2'-5' RNA ligase
VTASAPTARLFVGTWPPPDVVAALASYERPELAALRWTPSQHWHVTIAFLGNVELSGVAALEQLLVTCTGDSSVAPEARLGPLTERLGRQVLCVPVHGLDELACQVRAALARLLPNAGLDAPFRGHLTLARARGRRAVPASLAGVPLAGCWRVQELSLVQSELAPWGPRYTTLATATVGS